MNWLLTNKAICLHSSTALVGLGVPVAEGLRSHTNHNRQDSSGRLIGPTRRPPPDNTQPSQETDIHASGGIRIRKPCKRAATGVGQKAITSG